ncbi:uncharacterized protein CTRU02_202419 [Colletotrichum truncatum]|uniref:Uncharacterized protein n=1 Tax=Colletotrichum truncatum TaxID=5467 RepID=A0ACC3ZK69_COLTU|nr:uncharacterized protein CTRU02_01581 [Colletotrichum truncatum]KAF6799902.1 hypothetical protein CTRU02_01581 [Colletotrichum truncatum]
MSHAMPALSFKVSEDGEALVASEIQCVTYSKRCFLVTPRLFLYLAMILIILGLSIILLRARGNLCYYVLPVWLNEIKSMCVASQEEVCSMGCFFRRTCELLALSDMLRSRCCSGVQVKFGRPVSCRRKGHELLSLYFGIWRCASRQRGKILYWLRFETSRTASTLTFTCMGLSRSSLLAPLDD